MKRQLPQRGIIILMALLVTSCFEVKPIEFGKIKGVNVQSVANGVANIELEVSLINPNAFQVAITDAEVAIELNGTKMGTIDGLEKIKLPANSSNTYKIPIEVNLQSLMSNPLQLLGFFSKKQATIKIDGWVKGKARGFSKKVDVHVTQNAAMFQ